ncbi:MAG: hypothetical protein RLZZ224_581 [Verrucomicrobiota bacterium]
MIDEAWIGRGMSDKAKVRIQCLIDDKSEDQIAIDPCKCAKWTVPPGRCGTPAIAEGNEKRGADDGKVVQEKRKKRDVWKIMLQGRCNNRLHRRGEPPVIREFLRPGPTFHQGISCEKCGDVAEMKG